MEYIGLDYFLDSSKRIYWLYILSSIILSILFFRTQFQEQFSKKVLLHPSAKLDYIYFIIISIVKVLVIIPLMISINVVVLFFIIKLQDIFGFQERIKISREFLLISYTIVLFIINDFCRYWLHRILHLIPFLWQFHKVHHSAEVLNPLTFYRIHPIENILFGLRYTIVTGFVTALFIYFFGAGIKLIEILGVNFIVFIFMIIGSNLRHSHIPLRFGKRVEKWIISPYQHQLHHTKKYTHKNFGSSLAIWDRLFNTLIIKDIEKLSFGLSNQTSTHSLLGAFINPFYKGVKL